MGKDGEGMAASDTENDDLDLCREAHDVAGRPQEDRRRSKGEMGEDEGGAEEGGVVRIDRSGVDDPES